MKFLCYAIITTLISRVYVAEAIIGYDCSQQVSNLTTFSLIHIGECDIPEPSVNTTKPYIKLLQLNDFADTHVKLCKVEIRRSVSYCGAWSHRKDKNRGEAKFVDEITKEECKRMHIYRAHRIRDQIISNLKLNGTIVYPMTFVGKIFENGDCDSAGTYSDPYGTFDDAVVTGYVTITLQDYFATVNINSNEVILRSGTHCALNEDGCIDVEAGYAFWDPIPTRSCEQNKYSELYAGYVNKIVEQGYDSRPVYMLESSEVTFAFSTVGTIPVCAHELIRTEHPKLFILEGQATEAFSTIKNPTITNLDIFAYVNSKFVYVEKHIKGQVKRLYHDLIMQKCELEKRVIANALSIAATAPDLFAYQIMKQSGYMGLVAGEVVHLMKCVQVDVHRRESSRCYQELPVTKDGKDYYLTPRTHILKQFGTETTCSGLVPPMFLLGDSWLTILPNGATIGNNPTILKPATKSNWNYTEPSELAKSGIYTQKEIQSLRQHLMFPVERPAMLNTIALGMTGRATDKNGMSIARLFDEEALAQLANNTWNKMWSQFMTFGSVSAAVIGIVMIGRIIKFLIDTILHGYALYSLYGWSLKIIGAIWNSVTQLLLHAARDKPTKKQEKRAKDKQDEKRDPTPPPSPKAPLPPPPTPLLPRPNPVAPPRTLGVQSRYTAVNLDEGGENRVNCNIIDNRLYPSLIKENNSPFLPPRFNRKTNNSEEESRV